MGRASFKPKKTTKRKVGGVRRQADEPEEDPMAWVTDVDVTGSNATITDDILRKVYRLNILPANKRKKKDNKTNPLCLSLLRTQKINAQGKREFVEGCLGMAPDEMTKEAPAYLRRGMRNIANTCYLNSIVQLLFHIPELRLDVLAACREALEGPEKDTSDLVANKIPRLFGELAGSFRSVVDPKPFVTAMDIDPGVQQDAQEFFALFSHCLSDWAPSLNQAMKKIFGGTVLYERTCKRCKKVFRKADPISHLSLPHASTLMEGVLSMVNEDMDEYVCEDCGTRTGASSKMVFKSVPQYLVFQVMRFKFNEKFEKVKIDTKLQYPQEMDFGAMVEADEKLDYELVAVVNHVGASANCGHYVLHQKIEDDQEWYCFDDSNVTCVKKQYHSDDILSKDAYMLMYRRKTAAPVDATDDVDAAATMLASLVPQAVTTELMDEQCNHESNTKLYQEQKAALEAKFNNWHVLANQVFKNPERLPSSDDALCAVPRQWLRYLGAAGPIALGKPIVKQEGEDDEEEEGEFLLDPSTDSLRCPHGKLDPSSEFKFLPVEAFTAMVDEYPVENPLTSQEHLCERCAITQIRRLQKEYMERQEEEKMRQQASIQDVEKGFVVNTAILSRWVDGEVLDDEEVKTMDLAQDLVCEHGGLNPYTPHKVVTEEVQMYLTSRKGFLYSNPLDASTSKCPTCIDKQTAETAKLHDNRMQKMQENKKLPTLADENGNKQRFKDISKRYKTHVAKWEKARAAAAAKEIEEEEKKQREEKIQQKLQPLDKKGGRGGGGTKNDPIPVDAAQNDDETSSEKEEPKCPDLRFEYPMIDTAWVTEWRTWVKDMELPKEMRPKKMPSNASFLCKHRKLLYSVDELHPDHFKDVQLPPPLTICTQEEMDELCKLYDGEVKPELKFVELNDKRTTEPPFCEECCEARKKREAAERCEYESATINVEGRVKLDRRNFREVKVPLENVHYKMPIQDLRDQLGRLILGNYCATIDVNELKFVKGKTAFPVPHGTLFDNGVMAGTTMKFDTIKGEEVDEAIAADMLGVSLGGDTAPVHVDPAASVADRAPEANFGQSKLVGRQSGPVEQPKVKECGVCTYHNPHTRATCEMCESPLL